MPCCHESPPFPNELFQDQLLLTTLRSDNYRNCQPAELLEPGYWEDDPGEKYVRMILLMSMLGLSFQLKDGPKSLFWPAQFKRGAGDILVISFQYLLFGLAVVGASVVLTRIVFPAVKWESNWFLLPLILAAALWYYFQAEKSTG